MKLKKNKNKLNSKNKIIKNLENEENEIRKKLAKEVKKLKANFNEMVIKKMNLTKRLKIKRID